ncbi:hypothetical protein CLLI_05170 [Clostridium liquoris]|jgi:hypothetical protein|uniref:Uncharacterized protein n=1 Tax=Clostridium liquoris TaxID=1289519 RepID=A0A2T0B8J3_9CLOT|nr:hypothetical protein [Clostridium liquoris]PRR80133.1 hypothetical protein CLLI_05170 [Clostridium liquoris]
MKDHFKNWVEKVKKANLESLGTDEKLDYRIVYKDRLEKSKNDKEPLE